MKALLSIFLMICFITAGYAQKKAMPDDKAYTAVEVYPEFPGGDAALNKYISNNLRFPNTADLSDISQRTYIQFVVEKNGSLTGFCITKGSRKLGSELIRLFKASPRWKSGYNTGNQSESLIHFRLLVLC